MNHIKTIITGQLEENCYIIYNDTKKAIIVDPGDDFYKINDFIIAKELEVEFIFLTHGHGDHTGAVNKLQEKLNCPCFIHHQDMDLVVNGYNSMGFKKPDQLNQVQELPSKLLSSFNLDWHHVPGHTLGCCMLELKQEKILFVGDFVFKDDIGRCDLEHSDYRQMLESIKYLKSFQADYKIMPGHGPSTTLSYEKKHNPYF